MAVAFTVTGSSVTGDQKRVWGTFTSASGDTSASLAPSKHGLNNITDFHVRLNRIGAEQPLVTNSAGTLTLAWDDTLGASGTWTVTGK